MAESGRIFLEKDLFLASGLHMNIIESEAHNNILLLVPTRTPLRLNIQLFSASLWIYLKGASSFFKVDIGQVDDRP